MPPSGKGKGKKKADVAADPRPDPDFVRKASPAARKAAVEALAEKEGGLFAAGRAPVPTWKKGKPARQDTAKGAAATEDPAGGRRKPTRLPPAEREKLAATGTSERKVVLLDTNALMMQFQFSVNIEGELRRILDFDYEIVVPDTVVDELQDLAKATTGKDQQEARMALEFAKNFKVMETPAEGDAGILRLAEKLGAIVVTNDKLLRARLRAKDIANIHLRSRAFLTLEGHIEGM